jgi:hypothetical protein
MGCIVATLDVARRLAVGDVVILDGGTGSQLQAEGVPMDELAWSAWANLAQPGVVQRVHEEYIRAGAQVIITNTYAANRVALEPAGLGGQVAEVNRAAMRAALNARTTAASHPVAVAGSMSSFCPAVMAVPPGDAWFPGLAGAGAAAGRGRCRPHRAGDGLRARLRQPRRAGRSGDGATGLARR